MKLENPTLFVVAALCAIAANAANDAAAQEKKAAGGEILLELGTPEGPMPVAMAYNEIGVITREKEADKAVGALRQKLSAEKVASYEGGVYLITLAAPMTRSELFSLAYSLEAQDDAITNAGVVLYPKDAAAPMIATNSVIIQFGQNVKNEDVDAFLARNDLELVAESPYGRGRQVLARVKPSEGRDSISESHRMKDMTGVVFAHPDFITIIDYRQAAFTPNDPLFANQWHHNNNGASGGTADADGDTDFAWGITRGAAAVRIAVIDSGFDIAHEDLTPNRWTNAGEIAGNGVDDDANGCIDDVNGCTFNVTTPCAAGSPLTCGTGAVGAANHGTSVAGVAAARGHNTLGVSGACPNCTLIMIQNGATTFNQGLAIGYAGAVGANVLTNSWGYNPGTAVPANVTTAINNTAAGGTVIFWAMNNGNRNDCTGTPDISANANAIAISASSNQDRKVTESAWGNCMELLSPTHRGYGPNPNGRPAGSGVAYTGTLNIATTDRTGAAGYNNTSPQNAANGFDPTFCPAETGNRNYTLCFGGTSSATPYAAGVGGLMLSAAPALTRQQVQRAVQDTADKIEDSAGAYSAVTGFSTPATGVATHGFGRVNAFEAVRLVAGAAAGGRGNVDVFIRDNRLDWGNTEQPSNVLMEPTRGFIAHYESVDIKVDAGPAYQPAPANSAQFDALVDESPISGEVNKVYVRVRNRGATTAASVTVKLQWAFAGTALPALPPDYWTVFPADSAHPANRWTTLGAPTIANLQYSGASVAGGGADPAQILAFDFVGPPIDPSIPAFRHHCLLAVISSPQDPVSAASMAQLAPDVITPRDNNVTHKNVAVQDPLPEDGRFRAAFYVRNPFEKSIATRLSMSASKGLKVALEGAPAGKTFTLEGGAEKLVFVEIYGAPGAVGRVEIRQFLMKRTPLKTARRQPSEQPLGGVVYEFRAKDKAVPLQRPLIPQKKTLEPELQPMKRGEDRQ